MAGRPINENLATAKLVGDKCYEGATHEACGTNWRYTSTGSCVHCARAKQAVLREAAKGLTEPQHAVIREPWD